jgi:hypothetical protein
MAQILLPAEFAEEDRQIVLAYLQEGHKFDRQAWQRAVIAFDLLKNAIVNSTTGLLPFPVVYRQQVEDRYADAFIEQLYQTEQVTQISIKLWAEVAGKIASDLAQAGLYDDRLPTTRYLLAYCLYWWHSFTVGYALEIQIQQDLTRAGINFSTHDLRRRDERLSPYDLLVSGFKGDIKTSTYFLQAVRNRVLMHDFYITQVRSRRGLRTLVVFIQPDMWQVIDGDTLLVKLEAIADSLQDAVHILHQGLQVIVIDYLLWKTKMVGYQRARPEGSKK